MIEGKQTKMIFFMKMNRKRQTAFNTRMRKKNMDQQAGSTFLWILRKLITTPHPNQKCVSNALKLSLSDFLEAKHRSTYKWPALL